MRLFTLILLISCLAGCGAIPCIDAQFERQPIPIKDKFIFELTYSNGDIVTQRVECERYYDSMCAERGNSWKIRSVGQSSGYKASHVNLRHHSGEKFELELLHCEELVKYSGVMHLQDTTVIWGRDKVKVEKFGKNGTTTSWLGKSFRYLSSDGNKHRYQYGGYGDIPLEILKFEFDLTLNQQLILGGS
ncbi:MAG: hypothetical protein HRU22_16940 [Gammaproteobacteria bacterium]|nr:hypothetical protein [Gammaproteobacteria bacterium]